MTNLFATGLPNMLTATWWARLGRRFGIQTMIDFDSAIGHFQRALKATPQDATLHYDLGLALKLKDRLPEAIAEMRKATELDPGEADAHYTLGVTLWQQGAFDQSVEALQQAIRARPGYETRQRGGSTFPVRARRSIGWRNNIVHLHRQQYTRRTQCRCLNGPVRQHAFR